MLKTRFAVVMLIITMIVTPGCYGPWRKSSTEFVPEQTVMVHIGQHLEANVEVSGDSVVVKQIATPLCRQDTHGHLIVTERSYRDANPLAWLVVLTVAAGATYGTMHMFDDPDDIGETFMYVGLAGLWGTMPSLIGWAIHSGSGRSRKVRGPDTVEHASRAETCPPHVAHGPLQYAPRVTVRADYGGSDLLTQQVRPTSATTKIDWDLRELDGVARYCGSYNLSAQMHLDGLNTTDVLRDNYFSEPYQVNEVYRGQGRSSLTLQLLPDGDFRRLAQRCYERHFDRCAPGVRSKHHDRCEIDCLAASHSDVCLQEYNDCKELQGTERLCSRRMDECLDLFGSSRKELATCTQKCTDAEVQKACQL